MVVLCAIELVAPFIGVMFNQVFAQAHGVLGSGFVEPDRFEPLHAFARFERYALPSPDPTTARPSVFRAVR